MVIFSRPKSLSEKEFTYCPGCHHGIVHRLIAEVIDELGIQEKTIMVAPVGCSVFAYEFFNVDGTVAPHGRALAVATGIKRALPDRVVFTYQGDGDLAAIGIGETIHAANRGEKLTTIFINNAVYGMTGGQMAPTTLLGQKTTTTPYGRNPENDGYPFHVSEILSTLPGVAYLERVTVSTPQNIRNAKKAIRKAFIAQIKGVGFGLVEVLSTCPTNWGMSPVEAQKWLLENMTKEYPLGVFVDKVGD
ncbi:thiamine pyrophosphate-dependent enzyme [Thermotoga sp. KOL6]|uniref:thiamine pyrophosphate-dependent enzyme n=1 Tax=Thermotoga sp. KOL6 TaxID=126741 RepID=UPI000C772796|nr:thiamine pyrophosphate-dependent enzyme [Thermotoga sp. KOL6]PLV60490.1 2-oxoglutarate oxidoreductase [Thermotoga sp. KOL6]